MRGTVPLRPARRMVLASRGDLALTGKSRGHAFESRQLHGRGGRCEAPAIPSEALLRRRAAGPTPSSRAWFWSTSAPCWSLPSGMPMRRSSVLRCPPVHDRAARHPQTPVPIAEGQRAGEPSSGSARFPDRESPPPSQPPPRLNSPRPRKAGSPQLGRCLKRTVLEPLHPACSTGRRQAKASLR